MLLATALSDGFMRVRRSLCVRRQYPDPYVLNSRGNVQASLARWKGSAPRMPFVQHLVTMTYITPLPVPLGSNALL